MKRRSILVPGALFFFMVSSLPCLAADPAAHWPAWRGPQATGAAPHADPPLTWSEAKNVRFKVRLPGKGLSTPVIWGDRIFLTTAVPAGVRPDPETAAAAEAALPEWRQESGISPDQILKFMVLALDRSTGKTLWEKVLRESSPHEGTHEDASWASASAITDGELLVVTFGSHGTYALDLDGNLLWQTDLGDMSTRRGFGEGSSPLLTAGSVIINWDHEGPSFITSLDRTTGQVLWRRDRDEVTSWSSPLAINVGGSQQVVINGTGKTRSYDLATGQVIWEVGGMTVNTIPSPVTDGQRVYVASGYRGALLQAITLATAKGDLSESAAVAWTYEQDTPYVPSLLLAQGKLYFLKGNTGILTCLEAATGREIFSRQRLSGINGVYASPVSAGDRIYITGRDGTTVVLAGGDRFQVLAVNHLDDAFDASAALAEDALYLRGREHLYCLAGGAKPEDRKAGNESGGS